MARFVNPREQAELEEWEREQADKQLQKEKEENQPDVPETKFKEDIPADNKEDATWKKRYADLRKVEQQRREEAEALREQVERLQRTIEGVQKGTLKPPASIEEIEAWREQYPDFGSVLDGWIKKAIQEETKDIRSKLQKSEQEKALERLKGKHPDCEEIFADPAFHEWLKDQPKVSQKAIYQSLDVKEAAYVLTKYKDEIGLGKSNRDDDDDQTKEAAKAVKTSRSTPDPKQDLGDYEFSESQIEEACRKDHRWWDKNGEKVRDALRRGKVLLDITGGAR